MPTLDQVCVLLQNEIGTLLTPTQTPPLPPLQVIVGWPFGQSISEILGQYQAQVSVYPLSKAAQNRTSRKPHWKTSVPAVVNLIATVSDSLPFTITFSGSVTPGLNIHTFPQYGADAYYQTIAGDSASSIAAAVETAINNLALSGISASATGPVVTVTGALTLTCNIGGTATMIQEIRRTMCPVQVSVWAADGAVRNQIGAILENGMAPTFPSPMLLAPDQTYVWVRWRNAPMWSDDSQVSYSLYVWHAVFECEYATIQSTEATQVESIGSQIESAPIIYIGGI